MRLLSFAPRYQGPPFLETQRLVLRRPEFSDFEQWSALRGLSREFLEPWEPSWTADELSRPAFRQRIRRQESEINSGRGLPWFLFEKTDGTPLVGGLTLSNIRRGVAQSGTLGYWMGAPFAGQGLMAEAVNAVCMSVFRDLHLHRVEAATVPENERSQRLLLRCGFRREGTARSYLKIAGQWRDHLLFARLASDKAS